jgi:hypothetical protein
LGDGDGIGTGSGDAASVRVAFQAAKFDAHVGGMLVAQIAVFLESAVDDAFQIERQVRIQADRSERCLV